jgi:membrane associated rhomboid family serine protease
MRMIQDLQGKLRKGGTPATFVILGVSILIYLLSWGTQGKVGMKLAFDSTFQQPWGILTYPFASYGYGTALVWMILIFYWFYWIGMDNERVLGTIKFVAYFFLSALTAIIFLTLGALLLGKVVVEPGPNLAGIELATAAMTVSWAVRNKTATVRLMMCLPVPGAILGWLTVAIVLFGYGSVYGSPIMGVFACLHLGLAYLFTTNRLPGISYAGPSQSSKVLKAQEKRSSAYYDDVRKREQEREERERLRKLFEGSIRDDKDLDGR